MTTIVAPTSAPASAPASAIIALSTDGDWRVDTVPLIDACKTLSRVSEVFIQADRDATWRTIEPALLQVRKCGVSRLGARVNDHDPLWIEFEILEYVRKNADRFHEELIEK
ncbi:MAG: hypothetical protein A2289_04575 [Deltaproteobacteria bacterium RIFOXYA12_FULL_58_15]|nr:MAG: hypothetical protein A2289_04575 [Deltaproteobacteria bacterium RIFOXYA12_FULL_58_15]OGR08807.1 MAG: hypothetical protein A2341_10360 [Deltaproteobacteria bacterium RIFOXYB12_FULL_58_9]